MKYNFLSILVIAILVSCSSNNQPSREIATLSRPTATVSIQRPVPTMTIHPGRIAFVSEGTIGSYQIKTINADGSEIVTLAQNELSYTSPEWSPDGKKIVFQSAQIESPVVEDIWVMNADGTDKLNLTNDSAYNASPDWSPDGQKITFSSERDDNPEIYLINIDGSNLLRLTDHPAADHRPAWSPDGTKIAFVSDRDGSRDIYVMNIDDPDPVRLTQTSTDAYSPRWSPDGQRLSFILDNAIWLMNSDGSNQISATPEIVMSHPVPIWSSTGTDLLFTGKNSSDTHTNVYLVDVGTKRITRLTDDIRRYFHGSWSPDGTKISITGELPLGTYGLFTIDIDGSDMIKLTDSLGLNCCADWQPVTSK
jgi:Tol biopolymer transport system component